MSFQANESYIKALDVRKVECQIPIEHIAEIKAYTLDLIIEDEHRIQIETTDGVKYQFSEAESNWSELKAWLIDFAQLKNNWAEEAFPDVFSSEQTVLWKTTE